MNTIDTINVFQGYRGIDESSGCNRCRHGKSRLLPIIFCFLMVFYLFLYTNSFDNINISSILETLQKGPAAILNNTIDFLSDLKNPKTISNNQMKLTFITLATNLTVLSQSSQPPATNLTVLSRSSQPPAADLTTSPHSSQPPATNPTVLPHLLQPPAINRSALSSIPQPPAIQIIQQNDSNPWKQSIRELTKNRTKSLLTLMTSWIESEDKYLVHNLTTLNWLSLHPFVLPIVFTNAQTLAKVCQGAGWVVLPLRVSAADGVPVLKYMYIDAIKRFESDFYAFVNSDILFTDTLVETLIGILQNNSTSDNSTQDISAIQNHILIVGRRTNVYNISMEEGSSWSGVTKVAKNRGELFRTDAEDYFITSPSYPWNDIPEVVIGRRAYDNWLVLNARKQKHKVIDATNTILAVHQTTNKGNFEGMAKKTKDYNHNLLVSLHKSLQYGVGVTECAEYQTTMNVGAIMITSRRNLPRYCAVI